MVARLEVILRMDKSLSSLLTYEVGSEKFDDSQALDEATLLQDHSGKWYLE